LVGDLKREAVVVLRRQRDEATPRHGLGHLQRRLAIVVRALVGLIEDGADEVEKQRVLLARRCGGLEADRLVTGRAGSTAVHASEIAGRGSDGAGRTLPGSTGVRLVTQRLARVARV